MQSIPSPVTGEKLRDFYKSCLSKINALDENGRPRKPIWAITDEGSNIRKALRLLKEEGIIEGYHPCFNHTLQNVIKDAIKTTPDG